MVETVIGNNLDLFIYLFIYYVKTYSNHRGVGAHQRQGNRQERKVRIRK